MAFTVAAPLGGLSGQYIAAPVAVARHGPRRRAESAREARAGPPFARAKARAGNGFARSAGTGASTAAGPAGGPNGIRRRSRPRAKLGRALRTPSSARRPRRPPGGAAADVHSLRIAST
ncbi:hypothetical protein LG3211_1064 [Lysobacter gummosus]|nr:hypothetical protein LG3211_1064 [Lysobacter gummosus]